MQINRLFGILFHLLERGSTPARELAERYEVSVRTIYRDVETLSEAGIPIYATRGKGGGITLMEGFVLERAMISPEEQSQILLSLQGLSSTGESEAHSALDKLGHIFRSADTGWIEVDFTRWGSSEVDRHKFAVLKRAILSGWAISFGYASSYGRSGRRLVYPLKLVYKSAAWYVQGFTVDGRNYRTFKVNRMTAIETEDEQFSRIDFSPPPIEWGGEADMPYEMTVVDLDMHFSPELAFRIYDEFDPAQISRLPDDSYRVQSSVPEDSWLYSYLRSFGDGMEVIAPAHVREKLADMARAVLRLYKAD